MKSFLAAALFALLAVSCGSADVVHFARAPLGEGARHGLTPEAAFREKPPTSAAIVPFVPPVIVEARLSNGIRVLYLERHDFPIVALNLASSVGRDQAPLGVAVLWARLVLQGPDGEDRDKSNRAFEAHGADVLAWVDHDVTAIRLKVLSGEYRRSIEILGEAVASASFPASGLDEARTRQLSTIARRNDDPEVAARLTMFATLYPSGDRYHDDPGGTNGALNAVTRAQIVAYHRAAMDAGRLSIAVAGDFDPKLLLSELEKDFGKLPDLKAAPLPNPVAPAKSTAPRLVVVDRPGATQASVIVAAVGAPFDSPDGPALEVLRVRLSNAIDFNLREEHALTYGTQSSVVLARRAGPTLVEGALDKDHVGEAIKRILLFIETRRSVELSPEGLATGRDDAILHLAKTFDSTEDIAAGLGTVAAFGLPTSHFLGSVMRLQTVTAADVMRVANTYFAPEAIHIIVVGDIKVLKSQLHELAIDVAASSTDAKVDVKQGTGETPTAKPTKTE